MHFGEVVRALRTAKGLSLRALGERVGVSYAYISKVENRKIDFGDYPSAALIRRFASALDGDEEALLLLAEKIPETIRRRLFERPDAFRRIARLDDEALDRLLTFIDDDGTPGGGERDVVRRAEDVDPTGCGPIGGPDPTGQPHMTRRQES